jgi:hypothetical protein
MIVCVNRDAAMGAIALTMMLYFAPSWARVSEKPTIPSFAAVENPVSTR